VAPEILASVAAGGGIWRIITGHKKKKDQFEDVAAVATNNDETTATAA
jgi:hypothetical protein